MLGPPNRHSRHRPLCRVHAGETQSAASHPTLCPPPPPPLPPRPGTQEYLMNLPGRFRKLSERAAARKAKAKPVRVQFSWIFNREVSV